MRERSNYDDSDTALVNRLDVQPHVSKKVKLGEICEVTTGKWDANHSVSNGKYRFYTCAYDYAFCNTKRFGGECLILPGNGANVGEVFYYNGDFDAYQRTYVIYNIKINPKYLFYHLKLHWKKSTDSKQYGSATNYIRIGNFNEYQLSCPPTATQHLIVTKLEELFSELDKGVEQLKLAQQQLKVYRQAVLKWAFEGRLTNNNVKESELPEGWKLESLKNIGKWTGGGTPSKQNPDFWTKGTVSWVSPKDMKARIILETIDKITEGSITQSSAKWIKKGSILFVVRSGIIRRMLPIAIAGKDLTTNQDLQSLTLNNDLNSEFVYWYCVSNEQSIREACAKDGTTVDNLDVPKLKNYPIVICPFREQEKVIQEIESRLSVADKMEESINDALAQAEVLRQSILKRAFEGRLI